MYKYFIMIACLMFFYSCSEENNREPVTSDSTIPGQVSNVRVEPLPGALKLTYDMPSGQSLSYVKAECLINGIVRQVKASSYVNNLTMEGFADNSLYTIKLYSVNRSEKESEPVEVQATPLAPPFQEVFKEIVLAEDFGGAAVLYDNPFEADLAITIINMDSTGFWNTLETFYTNKLQGQLNVRGFQPMQTRFGVYLRDRWNNTTDTLIKDLTPRFEKELDETRFQDARLPSDPDFAYPQNALDRVWDRTANMMNTYYISATDGRWPQWFTIFLGIGEEGVLLSRFKLWQRGQQGYAEESLAYSNRNPRLFEVWGSMNPNPDGSWDESWTLLLDAEMIKPSGLPLGQMSDEDWVAMAEGNEFSFPLGTPYVRYVRFKVKETWGLLQSIHFSSIAFWGQEPSDVIQ